MPELPEVETVCRALRGPLASRSIAGVTINWPRTVEPLAPPEFCRAISGKRVESVFRRAKFIVFRLSDNSVLTTHLRMTGKLLYVQRTGPNVDEPTRHLRVALEFDNGDSLNFYDARKFGRMRHLSTDDWAALSRELGPEPLDPSFTGQTFYERLQASKRQIKPLLLDQTFIAGIGNIYADEALFKARIHPRKTSESISRRKAVELHESIVDTLSSALRNQGTTIRDYRSAPGVEGSNRSSLLVYGAQPGTKCPRCGTVLKRITVGQRGTTICPRCQRMR